ncbi:Papain-like cysteine protease AvrRpt2 [Streptomyces sp. TLI_053]|uniref:papain-like cysteine protease family protein n=1 Tax=Streptomyces sp. TLI_053 TaxID=1855352 RepID=UPI00087B4683|nr:papain-like cysteine protease family protein [Streptomyces sp. TLI_053]SDT82968.1 Papain-like cysteine protease AvrRpt2 [Streptomyces sp. TLI_053]
MPNESEDTMAIECEEAPEAEEAVEDAKELAFAQLVQERRNWCWAAAGLSIAQYFGAGTDVTQADYCALAAGPEYNWATCPDTSATMEVVQAGLRGLGLEPGLIVEGPLDLDLVKEEIDAGRPVLTRVNLAAGGAHALVVHGYWDDHLIFSDPDPDAERHRTMEYRRYRENETFTWVRSLIGVTR